MGAPGSGKTTIIREIARKLSEEHNLLIVDTSNEIAGDGDIPHPCIGLSRRVQVPGLDLQGNVMIECVQNHSPSVMVIDEIGRPTEVAAARTVKQRGVRVIASAHGDFRKLSRNGQLRGLLGSTENVLLKGGVPKTVRVGEPTFDVIIEVRPEKHDEWVVVMDVAGAYDRLLERKDYLIQRRVRDPTTGGVQVFFEKG